jgi:hypothetical protein
MLATFLLSAEANAQEKKVPDKSKFVEGSVSTLTEPFVTKARTNEILKGCVVDAENNEPIVFASILIKGNTKGFVTDSLGIFFINETIKNSKQISISAVGYESQTIQTDTLCVNTRLATIKLQRSEMNLGIVSIAAYPMVDCNIIAGGIVAVQKVSVINKIRDTLVTIITKNPIRIFPNPVNRSGIVSVQFATNEIGEYKMEVINAVGQILKQETFIVTFRNQIKQLFIDDSYKRGTYFIRVKDPADKKKYQNKFIVR